MCKACSLYSAVFILNIRRPFVYPLTIAGVDNGDSECHLELVVRVSEANCTDFMAFPGLHVTAA